MLGTMISQRTPIAVVSLILVSAAALSGCSGFKGGGSGGSATLASEISEVMLQSTLPTRAYTYQDKNTADIYLTDLSQEQLTNFFENDADWSSFTGSLVHIHLFLTPKPGRTPIEPTAANATVRYIVLAEGEIGVYDGAGFILPGKKIGKDSLSGSLMGAPAKLTRRTANFHDPLPATRLDLSFSARRNSPLADELRARVNALSSATDPVD